MEEMRPSETLVSYRTTTRRHSAEDLDVRSHCVSRTRTISIAMTFFFVGIQAQYLLKHVKLKERLLVVLRSDYIIAQSLRPDGKW
jgi:hypothetical protein